MDVSLKKCLNIGVLGFLIFWPVIDTLNGYLYYNHAFLPSVSAPYKAVGFIVIATLLMIYDVVSFVKLFLFIVLSMLCFVYQYMVYGEVIESITWAVRGLLTLALIFYLISESKRNCFWSKKRLANLMLFYFLMMAFNVSLGVVGVGESQYAGGIGGKGFIIAGNEMSYLMLVSASIVLVHLAGRFGFLGLSLVFMGLLVFFLMKATKVAILGICLSYVFVLIHQGYFKVKYIPALYTLMLVGGALAVLLGYQFAQATGLLDRMVYLYGLHGGFWGAVLSGRMTFLQDAFDVLLVNFNFLDTFFGVGVDHMSGVSDVLVEIDLIDVFIAFGIAGPIMFYFPWLLGITWSLALLKTNPMSGLCFMLLIFMFLGVSVTSGHVVNSGIASSATAFFISYLYILKEEQKHVKGDQAW
ncbi:hypothetical protein [Halomonas sp. SpR8]|uniref:hypothetical protein n=1 Tax=Halomonas sp. SpR8 TaxID=3050463 RepID=UPI0027E451D3|nr:hypothetical protein [Halomonas sp. SpR8]MDQ7727262.1 hypothetical protein [Halomonas sp. SpR8]